MARLSTITAAVDDQQEIDSSANIRLALAGAQLEMSKDRPLGAGHRGTRTLSPLYLAEEYLTKNTHGGGENRARSSHNTLLAVLVDQGWPGLAAFLLLLAFTYNALLRMKKAEVASPISDTMFDYSAMRMGLAGALTVILVAGVFSNFLKAEVFVWIVTIIFSLQRLVDEETDRTAESPIAESSETLRPARLRSGRRTINSRP